MTMPLHSCFISYAHTDNAFAQKLKDDLEANGVSCWMDIEDMSGGKFWRAQISAAIKDYDKLLIICSAQSLVRPAVVDEVLAAIERERESRSQKLFPIRLDNFLLTPGMLNLADEKMSTGEWREDWVRYVRAYHIPDFSRWKERDEYQREFKKLINALKNPGER